MQKSLAYTLDQKSIKWAYKIYWDRKFLKEAEIEKLNQTEQDRIFNELIVSAEILVMATLKWLLLKCLIAIKTQTILQKLTRNL